MKALLRACMCALLIVSGAAWAHTSGSSFITLQEQAAGMLVAKLDVDLRDLNVLLELDQDSDGAIRWGEVDRAGSRIESLVMERVHLRAGKQPCAIVQRRPLSIAEHGAGPYVRLNLTFACASSDPEWTFDQSGWFEFDPAHRALLEYRSIDGASTTTILTQTNPSWRATEPTGARLHRFAREGVRHLLSGYDHLAFLGVLLLALVRRRQLQEPVALPDMLRRSIAIITAFTVAHSLTLALAAEGHITLPSRPVEIAIAASVLLAAVLNLGRNTSAHGWKLALGFGLVHGLGFAGALTELSGERLDWLALAAFNVGIELAQIAIAIAAVPLLWRVFRDGRSERLGVPLVSVGCAVLAATWTVTRWLA